MRLEDMEDLLYVCRGLGPLFLPPGEDEEKGEGPRESQLHPFPWEPDVCRTRMPRVAIRPHWADREREG